MLQLPEIAGLEQKLGGIRNQAYLPLVLEIYLIEHTGTPQEKRTLLEVWTARTSDARYEVLVPPITQF